MSGFINRIFRFREKADQIRELEALHSISRSMHILNLEEILQNILEGVTQVIGFDRARLYLLDEETNTLRCRMAVGIEREKIEKLSLPLGKGGSILRLVVLEKKPYVVEDAMCDTRVNPDLKKLFNLKSFAAVPLLGHNNKILGAISADNLFSQKAISREKVKTLQTFAIQAGLAIENAQAYEKTAAHLKATQDKLIQAEKLAVLGRLSAAIAHEIRNPLTSIKILINSLNLKDESQREDIKVINGEIERINRMINRLLEFSRPGSPQFARVDPNAVLEETLKIAAGEMKACHIELEKDLKPLPSIMADRGQLKQVFLNLILNAIQAMPQGGNLKIRSIPDSDFVRISIEDSGRGISDDVKVRLFEPFFTTKEDGLGLGLSIVQRIVHDHNGVIEVKDARPKGAIFTVSLPKR